MVVTPGVVVLVTAEDRRALLIARLGRIMEALGLDDKERATVCERVMPNRSHCVSGVLPNPGDIQIQTSCVVEV
ncbi:MAG: hypothetical protein LC647_14900 [Beggiatoa sp.]|nr:hypothetical protein [Beggiatoa sp.]